MNKHKAICLGAVLLLTLLTSACGQKSGLSGNSSNSATTNTNNTSVSATPQNSQNNAAGTENSPGNEGNSANPSASTAGQDSSSNASAPSAGTAQNNAPAAANGSDQQILIVIDQTPKPTDVTRSFDFGIRKVPEGYSLAKMEWASDNYKVANTPQEALVNGQNGGDGFYISGDGQFTGFFYPEDAKGDKGQVSFLFKNDQGKELTWKKEVTLK